MTTPSLFEREMHDQIEAAQAAVADALRHGDLLSEQAARSHLEALIALARRNGVPVALSDLGDPVTQGLGEPVTMET